MEIAKKAAGSVAADFVEDGMIVGLGTGTTAAYFIQALIKKKKKICAVASSLRSQEMAKEGGIRVLDISDVSHIDLTVDGADEIDPQKRMIKGGGGAHVREKILATSSLRMIIIVDETKLVPHLGRGKLPVEIVPYGAKFTKEKLEKIGYKGHFRTGANLNNELFVTENGNLLLDITFSHPLQSPEKVEREIIQIPGVVDTGFFFNPIQHLIVGQSDGTTLLQ